MNFYFLLPDITINTYKINIYIKLSKKVLILLDLEEKNNKVCIFTFF